jgi:hypothetical protein
MLIYVSLELHKAPCFCGNLANRPRATHLVASCWEARTPISFDMISSGKTVVMLTVTGHARRKMSTWASRCLSQLKDVQKNEAGASIYSPRCIVLCNKSWAYSLYLIDAKQMLDSHLSHNTPTCLPRTSLRSTSSLRDDHLPQAATGRCQKLRVTLHLLDLHRCTVAFEGHTPQLPGLANRTNPITNSLVLSIAVWKPRRSESSTVLRRFLYCNSDLITDWSGLMLNISKSCKSVSPLAPLQ